MNENDNGEQTAETTARLGLDSRKEMWKRKRKSMEGELVVFILWRDASLISVEAQQRMLLNTMRADWSADTDTTTHSAEGF